jgi:lipoprotein-releasing system permease protein
MKFEWFVASRYLRAKGRSKFRALITLLAVGGVTVGVAAAIIVFGVMDGFAREVRSRIVGTNAHVVLLDQQERGILEPAKVQRLVEKVPGVVATAPFIVGKVLLSSDTRSEGAVLRGLDKKQEMHVTEISGRTVPRDATVETTAAPDGTIMPAVILGIQLAGELGAGVGDVIAATVPETRRHGIPRTVAMVVTGLFESGMYEYDSALALTSLEGARSVLDFEDERVTGILVRVHDLEKAPEVGKHIVQAVPQPPLFANDWIQQNRQLFQWMDIEKRVGYLLFALILIVAAFLIASTLIMIVLEKTREIGILLSLGATPRSVWTVFLLEGVAIGGLGTVLGCICGIAGCGILDHWRFDLPGEVYFIETLPVALWWGDVVLIAVLASTISILSALYPSWMASRLLPVEAIRYE